MYANERKMMKCEYFGPDLTREEGNEFGSHVAGRTLRVLAASCNLPYGSGIVLLVVTYCMPAR